MPDLPDTGALVAETRYVPLPDGNTMPSQEPGTKPARALPVQPNAKPSRSVWNRTTAATAPVGAADGGSGYDITVIGPNRFLRRFTGDTAAAGAKLSARIDYFEGGFHPDPRLLLTLVNDSPETVTFTVTANAYSHDEPRTYHVPAHRSAVHTADPLRTSGGWYDLTVTTSTNSAWSQRYSGHLENGGPSITGA